MTGKSVAEKLLVKPGTAVWASAGRLALLGPLPEGVAVADEIGGAAIAVLFVDDAAALRETLDANRSVLARPAVFWVAYPKGNRADINRDSLWPILTDYGMRPIGQVAIDEAWSALRFRPLAEGEAQFTGR